MSGKHKRERLERRRLKSACRRLRFSRQSIASIDFNLMVRMQELYDPRKNPMILGIPVRLMGLSEPLNYASARCNEIEFRVRHRF